MLNTAWFTKTDLLVFTNAEDKDTPPKSLREMKTSPITASEKIPSTVIVKEGIVGVMGDKIPLQESKTSAFGTSDIKDTKDDMKEDAPTFRLGGQLTFSITYIHTQSDTTFYVGITLKLPKPRAKHVASAASTPAPPHFHRYFQRHPPLHLQ